MEKIKKYVIGFFKKVSIRRGYDISQEEWKTLVIEAKENLTDAIIMSFFMVMQRDTGRRWLRRRKAVRHEYM